MSKTRVKPMVEWRHINWRKLERRVFKLQKRIYQASQRGEVKALRRLQKTMMKSWSARCLAVRRVTQDNQGKKTAGVDGLKSLTPKQRLTLVTNLKLSSKVAPTRRVWIPKPGTQEKRPLGIPTMKDRALQALVKLALEPEWEARFEPNSYGFRAWAKRRHPQKAVHWIVNKYWKTIGGNKWVFATSAEGENLMRLRTHSETSVVRHVKVKGESSPYDADLVYWSTRMGKHPEISTREATLLKRQKGKCNHCGLFFRDGDIWEIDHNIPRSKGGKDEYNNLQLLHKHCHDVKTAEDGSAGGSIVSYPNH